MPKSISSLLDEILTETKNYRCEYLQVLIEKYVKNQDKGVDIYIHNLKVTKSADYLKRIKEQPFGYVSSYECKSAKKTIHYWKKRVILQKRASFRKYVGAESSADHSTNLKYLSRKKAYKTLLSIQKDKSCSLSEECESTLLNETEFDDDQTVSFSEEDESTLCCRDSSFLSDTVKSTSKKRPNNVSEEDETIKTLVTRDKYSFSANNVQEFSNFQIKNCNVNLLKPNNHKKLDLLIENYSTVVSNISVGKAPKMVCQKMAVHLKGISSSSNKDERNSVSSVYNDYTGTSFLDYIASKSTPKFKFSDIGLGISNNNRQISSFCNVNSLPYNSNNSAELSKLKPSIVGMETFNKICQASDDCNVESVSEVVDIVQFSNDCNSKSSCASDKSTDGPKLRSRKDEMVASNENCQTSDNSNTKSLPYASDKDIRTSKLRPREGGKVISNKNCQISSNCNAESPYVLNKSTRASKLRSREDGKVVSTKNRQSSSDYNLRSLSYASTNSVEDPNLMLRGQTCDEDCGTSFDCNSESLKSVKEPNLKCKENGKLTSIKNCVKPNDCNTNSLPNTSSKSVNDRNLKPREDKNQNSNKNYQKSSNCDAKSLLSYTSNKCKKAPNLLSEENQIVTSNENCQSSSDSNVKSVPYTSDELHKLGYNKINEQASSDQTPSDSNTKPCTSNKSTEFSKLKSWNDRAKISDKNVQTSNDFDTKSLSSASSKFAEPSQLKFSKIDEETSNKNLQASDNCSAKSLSYVSNKCAEAVKFKTKEDETPSDNNTKPCTSNKSTEFSKLKSWNDGAKISDKNVQTSNDFDTKSLSSASSKFAEPSQLKFSKIGKEISNKNLQASGNCSAKSLSYVSNKCTEAVKFNTKKDETVIMPKKNCETSSVYKSKSLSFASTKHTEVLKLKPIEDETRTSKTYFQASNVRNAKSLIYPSDETIEPCKHNYSNIGTKASSKNRQTLLNSFPLRCTSLSSSLSSNIGISAEIDPLSVKRVFDSKRPYTKKSSLSQSALPFSKTKTYKKYLDEGVKLDDLSLKSPRKTSKNGQKDKCLK